MPRWLVLLLTGTVIGAGGVVFVQERYLPPRLSAADTTRLRSSFESADAERQRLKGELADTRKRLDAALSDTKRLGDELAASRQTNEGLRQVNTALVASLPPDPRGGAVEVRAARFSVEGGALAYDVVITRERAGAKPLPGVMQLLVTGTSARGTESTVALKPVTISMGPYESLRGSLDLPEGFKARQTTINLLDRIDGKALGHRVMNIK